METMMENSSPNPFQTAQLQFDRAADWLGLDQPSRDLLRVPLKEYHVRIPLRMDDGTIRVLRGYRVIHNDARGPARGGVRFHPAETIDTLRALAMWMTWECALIDIPLGGSSGGVACDPHDLRLREQEQLCRAWVRALASDLGPGRDVPGPDVMTGAQHMMWMLDEYEVLRGERLPGSFTGKPAGLGGTLGGRESTGYGIVFTLREALKELDLPLEGTTASVQGFGNVGQQAVRLFGQIGGKVTCVSCWDQKDARSYAYKKDAGIDYEALAGITDRFGGIDKEKARRMGYEALPGEAWLAQDVDILIPAAVENQITEGNVGLIGPRVRVLAEGANGPTTPGADQALAGRGILVIPDILANAGGVTSGYFEQVQSHMNYYWEKDEVLGKLDVKMTSAFHTVLEFSKSRKLAMRDAAFALAVARVAEACKNRGWV
jgi:glutamate dehydrogenase (NAD(P)+)